MPSEVFAMDVSADGNHFVVGLNDGSLVVKSKLIEIDEKDVDEEEKIMKMFEPTFNSTSKNYKYFYRGQYVVTPDASDITTAHKAKKRKL